MLGNSVFIILGLKQAFFSLTLQRTCTPVNSAHSSCLSAAGRGQSGDAPLSTVSRILCPSSLSNGMPFGGSSSSRGRLNHLSEILDKSVTELESEVPVLLAWPCQLLIKSRWHRALLGQRNRSDKRVSLSPPQPLSQSQAEARVQTSVAFSLGGTNV